MKRKTIFNTLMLTLMVFSSLFVANLSPHIKVSAESIPVTLVSGNKYRDGKGNYYEKAIAGVSADSKITVYTMPSTGTKPTRGDTLFFKYEPIVWQVLDYDSTNKRALIVSEKVLANMPFQPTFDYVSSLNFYPTAANGGDGVTTHADDYAYSNIRYWLNGYTQKNQTGNCYTYASPSDDEPTLINFFENYNVNSITLGYGESFYDYAFTTNQQNQILATTGIGTDDITTYVAGEFNQTKPSPTSADKIFLLSYGDITNSSYYTDDASRRKKSTDYSASQGLRTTTSSSYLYNAVWYTTVCRYVSVRGDSGTTNPSSTNNGIAPAMYLDTTDLTFYTTADCTTPASASAGTYVQFGSYPQTVVDCTTTINIPEAGVSINIAGIILSSTILIGLLSWAGTIGIKSLNKKKKI